LLKDKFILALKGFCIGAADVVPGVSGGTMAFILGIYKSLLDAIRSFDKIWLLAIIRLDVKTVIQRPHFGFLLPLVIGLFAAVLFFTRVIPLPSLLNTHPEPIYGLFFGLIVGSILTLLPTAVKWDWATFVFLSFGTLIGWAVVNLIPVTTPDATWFIVLSGFIGISAMLLPGISGSFILLILNKYETILNGISHFNFAIIIPFGLGVVLGLVIFSRFFDWLLEHFYRATLLSIIGILIGSLWRIWPFQDRHYVIVREKAILMESIPLFPDFNATTGLAFVMMALGLIVVLGIHALANGSQRKNVKENSSV
jgi:putative membrane protein